MTHQLFVVDQKNGTSIKRISILDRKKRDPENTILTSKSHQFDKTRIF
jgi:hypothetical protein